MRTDLLRQVVAERSKPHVVDGLGRVAETGNGADSFPRMPHRVGVLDALLEGTAWSLIEAEPIAQRPFLDVAIIRVAGTGAAG